MDNSPRLGGLSEILKAATAIGLALGILLVLVQEWFGPRWLFLSMWGSFGIAALSDGLRAVLTREALFLPNAVKQRLDLQSGIAARLFGGVLLLLGVGLAGWAFGDLLWPGQITGLLTAFSSAQRWGLLSGVIGIVLGLYGWARLLAGPEYRRSGSLGDLQEAIYRGVGGLLVLLGAGLALLGLVLIVAPDLIATLLGLQPSATESAVEFSW